MDMIPVSIDHSETLMQIRVLYESCFPQAERREWEQVLTLLRTSGSMEIHELRVNEQFTGFLIGWQLPDFYFIEHFAIQPQFRGQQYGGTVISILQSKHPCIVLECEPPSDDYSIRRISFYEKLGFAQFPFPYFQPAYRTGEAPLAMLLMRFPADCSETMFQPFVQSLNNIVYRFDKY